MKPVDLTCDGAPQLASPLGNGGRGLKPITSGTTETIAGASPLGNGGRGLKQVCWYDVQVHNPSASPLGNGGRGLKRSRASRNYLKHAHRPSATGGVD